MKPILFNTEMVRAVLSGRKTQTRRVVKLKYSNTHLEMRTDKYGTRLIEIQNEEPDVTRIQHEDGTTSLRLRAYIEPKPPYKKGDTLYVRETWAEWTGGYVYKADDSYPLEFVDRWHPSIHMPKEAARLFLRVTDVRVERLQEIDETGALAEGLYKGWQVTPSSSFSTSARQAFMWLWQRLTGKGPRERTWLANPWVWVICFERVEKAEDGDA